MRRAHGRAWVVAVMLLGCGPAPSEVLGPADGTSDPTTGTASTSTPMPGTSSPADTTADGTGGATGQSIDTGSDGGTTMGVQAGTSTGELASTGEVASTGAGTSTGGEPGTSTGASPSCDELYGAAPDYLLCMETEDECHFNATTNGGDCNAMCGMFEGACIDAIDNSVGCSLNQLDTDTCDTDRTTEVCVCSK